MKLDWNVQYVSRWKASWWLETENYTALERCTYRNEWCRCLWDAEVMNLQFSLRSFINCHEAVKPWNNVQRGANVLLSLIATLNYVWPWYKAYTVVWHKTCLPFDIRETIEKSLTEWLTDWWCQYVRRQSASLENHRLIVGIQIANKYYSRWTSEEVLSVQTCQWRLSAADEKH